MALRVAVLASLPASLLGAKAAPGCGCEVSRCCQALVNGSNTSRAIEVVFDSTGSAGVSVTRDKGGYTPACGLLGLIPGAFDSQGACSASLAAMENTTVCEALEANPEASERLQKGMPVLSVFLEPGRCAELHQEGVCWTSRDGQAAYSWQSDGGHTPGSSWCTGSVPVTSPALAWSMTCPSEGGLTFRAQWVDNAASTTTAEAAASTTDGDDVMNGSDMRGGRVLGSDYVLGLPKLAGGVCDEDAFTGGLKARVAADGWKAGAAGSPKWVCFDVPRGDPDLAESRLLAYSVGDLPCFAAPTMATTEAPAINGASGTSWAILAHAAAVAAAVGTTVL